MPARRRPRVAGRSAGRPRSAAAAAPRRGLRPRPPPRPRSTSGAALWIASSIASLSVIVDDGQPLAAALQPQAHDAVLDAQQLHAAAVRLQVRPHALERAAHALAPAAPGAGRAAAAGARPARRSTAARPRPSSSSERRRSAPAPRRRARAAPARPPSPCRARAGSGSASISSSSRSTRATCSAPRRPRRLSPRAGAEHRRVRPLRASCRCPGTCARRTAGTGRSSGPRA